MTFRARSLVASLAVAAVVASACGDGDAARRPPSTTAVHRSTGPAPSNGARSTPTSIAESVRAPATTVGGVERPDQPDALPPDASAPQLAAAAKQTLGPTDDLVGELGRFVEMPMAIPTPDRASIDRFTVDVRYSYFKDETAPDAGARRRILSARIDVTLSVPAEPDDADTFYEAGMTAVGYRLSEDYVESGSRILVFEAPGEPWWRAVAVDIWGDSRSPTVVGIRFIVPATETSLARLAGWPQPLPGPADRFAVDSASVSAPAIYANAAIDANVYYRVRGSLDDDRLDPASIEELYTAVVDALPTAAYRRARHRIEPFDGPSCLLTSDGRSVALDRDDLGRTVLSIDESAENRPTKVENVVEERYFLGLCIAAEVGW